MLLLKGSALPLNHTWANSKYFVISMTRTQQEEHFDIIVIGAGPAGEAAAMNAKKKGFTMAVVTDEAKVGGSCTHWATIPSKALRHSVKQVIDRNTNPLCREFGDARKLSFQQILKNSEVFLS